MSESWPRIMLHADMDAFYAAVEQLDNPDLRGKPVLVGGPSKRGVVSTASYEARPFGVGSALPMVEAMRRCPQAIVVPPNFERYQDVSRKVMEVFDTFSPLVEPLSLDEAFLDMTGSETLFGPPQEMGRKVKAAVKEATEGLTVSVGVSTTKYVAKVASDYEKPDGLTVVPKGAVHDFLWPLEVKRLWGVGAKTRARLLSLGFQTIGDVAHTSKAELTERFGALGTQIHDLSWARDDRDVTPRRAAKSIGAEFTLETDVVGQPEIEQHLRRVAQKIGQRLRKAKLAAGGVRVKLKTADFRLLTRQVPVRPPTDSTKELLAEATALLRHFDLQQPMRLVGMAAFHLTTQTEPKQKELFPNKERQRQRRLDETLDALHARFGTEAVRRGFNPKEIDEVRAPPSPHEFRRKKNEN